MHAGYEHKYKHQHKCVRMVTCERGGRGGYMERNRLIGNRVRACARTNRDCTGKIWRIFANGLGAPTRATRGGHRSHTRMSPVWERAQARARGRSHARKLQFYDQHNAIACARVQQLRFMSESVRSAGWLSGWLALGWMARSIAPCHHHQHHRQSFFMYHHVRPYVRACCVRPCSACPCPCVCVCLYAHAERGPATSLS